MAKRKIQMTSKHLHTVQHHKGIMLSAPKWLAAVLHQQVLFHLPCRLSKVIPVVPPLPRDSDWIKGCLFLFWLCNGSCTSFMPWFDLHFSDISVYFRVKELSFFSQSASLVLCKLSLTSPQVKSCVWPIHQTAHPISSLLSLCVTEMSRIL